MGYTVRSIAPDDVEAFLRLAIAIRQESGVRGTPIFAPYSSDEPPRGPSPERIAELRERLGRPTAEPDWYRGFLLFSGKTPVGELSISGGRLLSERHRGTIGMGILDGHRGRGHGERLLSAGIAWAAADPVVEWLDLGVFSGNERAQRLYTRLGFVETGRVPDRFRVDGKKITDIQMSLRLAVDGPARGA